MSYVPYRTPPVTGLKIWLPPIVVSGLLWWLSPNTISVRQGLLATLLFFFPCYAYNRWQRDGRTRIPLFALLALAHWAAFAMPLFLADPPADPQTYVSFGEVDVYRALEMAVIGVAALGLGMKMWFRPINPRLMPDISDTPGAWRYLYCALGIGAILSISESWLYLMGQAGEQFMIGLANIVPLTICAMLATRQTEGTSTPSQRLALRVFVAARVVIGIASGWLGPVVFVGVILAVIYTSKRRRLPIKAIAVIIPAFLFLQAGKTTFRGVYWSGGKTGGVIEKAAFWLEASFTQWNAAFTHRDHQGTHDLFAASIDRVALLTQAVNVVAKTPGVVPYQEGKSYSFLAATLIPRVVWPQKPTVNDANRFYQVAYGLTSPEDLGGVSIAVGCLTESFMNFGWWGVAPVMFALGFLLGMFERTLLTDESGVLFYGVGLALLSPLLTIESQAAQYLGGLLQQIGVVFVVVLPVIRRRKTGRDQLLPLPEAV